MARIKNWTKMTPEELWGQWQEMFSSEDEAVATAMWAANRFVKDRAKSTKEKFYSIKDEFIYRIPNAVGKRVREEIKACRACLGSPGKVVVVNWDQTGWNYRKENANRFGYELQDMRGKWYVSSPTAARVRTVYSEAVSIEDCPRCEGTGKYMSRWLYLHEFEIAGQKYSFHSYVVPENLSDEMGEDCERYGGQFNDDELDELALPVSGLLKILGYVAVNKWDMTRFDNFYVNQIRVYKQHQQNMHE